MIMKRQKAAGANEGSPELGKTVLMDAQKAVLPEVSFPEISSHYCFSTLSIRL
jgi:hypothetical protein